MILYSVEEGKFLLEDVSLATACSWVALYRLSFAINFEVLLNDGAEVKT